ncbi:hypothetical protein ACIQ9P_08950 [Kitasatospora sp. NPDC094019]|uniref:hypothetical protein n=1 Tax=Kitasatospora sp. NPDC094019 TaxID=3364091 RepID=UPI00381EA918
MCRRTTCRTCGKAGYAGCGMHVEQVLAGVPEAARCTCDRNAAGGSGLGGLLARILGRR